MIDKFIFGDEIVWHAAPVHIEHSNQSKSASSGDIPKTRNAKVMRRIIRSAYLDEDPGDTSSLVNPDAVSEVQLRR